ncbi:hypothetical protein FQN50_005450 [Emmonsiellopsis sp. PD_5]|nr:hypothetical protein FQN50_005450 [Emmonsiellopsis sp. PD_5]
MYWDPAVTLTYYQHFMSNLIMTERTMCLKECYWTARLNVKAFQETWGENSQKIKVVKGPRMTDSVRRSTSSGSTLDTEDWLDIKEFEED